ncbi:acetyl-CoA C-acetyltransferase [Rhodanobacter sp. KK11]|uniref:acetyl-CoA C-acetyltransferase n=1 Tax=Rhodanobacter sp. KK11 TaxID=3083255 RepID=UPI0029674716|nr:acetyl-CoA C-acetyltransferase [Rhodanobacter sp. KK11]MDW2981156.1 acetyl-CoA C-acetyltransferase [Rhodanobacter sp. KK11]
MENTQRRVGVIGGVRIPFCRNNTAYADVGNFGMSVKVLGTLVERFGLHGVELGEVAMGAVIKHASDWNLAREALLSSGLAPTTPGITTARACGTSLDNTIIIANKIAAGQIEAGIAGGSDTTSDVPIVYGTRLRKRLLAMNRARTPLDKLRTALRGFSLRELKPSFPGVAEPRTGKSMGDHCEQMARTWHISREAQDRLALDSHHKLAAAYEAGFFEDLLVPFRGLKRDGFLRPDTTLENLAALKPAFDKSSGHGTLTAGNSTGLSDGAAAVLLGSDAWAAQRGLKVQAYLRDAEVAAVDFVHGEGLLMAPTIAVPRMLARHGLSLQDFDYYEIHEAFAAQVLCTLRAWESADYCKQRLGLDAPLGSIDPDKLNVHGSSLAVGHPFAATGARIVATLAKLLEQKGSGRGLISICTAGGMGVTAILER